MTVADVFSIRRKPPQAFDALKTQGYIFRYDVGVDEQLHDDDYDPQSWVVIASW